MPPKKTATLKKATVASSSLSRAARASPAPRKKTGRDEGLKASDVSDMSSEHSVCPICENVIVDFGEMTVELVRTLFTAKDSVRSGLIAAVPVSCANRAPPFWGPQGPKILKF